MREKDGQLIARSQNRSQGLDLHSLARNESSARPAYDGTACKEILAAGEEEGPLRKGDRESDGSAGTCELLKLFERLREAPVLHTCEHKPRDTRH